jgi:DNA-binding transcriptional LysR family regulator
MTDSLGTIISQVRDLLGTLEQARTLDQQCQAAERQTRARLASLLRLAEADGCCHSWCVIILAGIRQRLPTRQLQATPGHAKIMLVFLPPIP